MAKHGATPLARLRQQLSVCDVLFEVRDARLPSSSQHPSSQELFGKGARVVVLTKKDLADPNALAPWIKVLSGENCRAISLSLKTAGGKEALVKLALQLTKDKMDALSRKGILPRPVRACVVGLPNVGKSSLINWLTGKKKAAVANRPGVTRAPAWIRVHPQLELLDTPGILPPVMFTGERGVKLALCNILPGEHYDAFEVATAALELLPGRTTISLSEHYGLSADDGLSLESIARARSCMAHGGTPDEHRAAALLIQDFRTGKLGGALLDPLPKPTAETQD